MMLDQKEQVFWSNLIFSLTTPKNPTMENLRFNAKKQSRISSNVLEIIKKYNLNKAYERHLEYLEKMNVLDIIEDDFHTNSYKGMESIICNWYYTMKDVERDFSDEINLPF